VTPSRSDVDSREVSEDEVLGYLDSLSNWGRWGPDDELGTLNFITPVARAAASALVRDGTTVSCGWDIDTDVQPDQVYGPPQRLMILSGQGHHDPDVSETAEFLGRGAAEWFGMAFHGLTETHLDAPSHKFWRKQMYNGVPAEMVTSWSGARRNAVTAAAGGIVSRGVLLDVAAVRGVDWLESPDGAGVADLEAAEARQGIQVGAGDIVLLRTGGGRKRREAERADIRRDGIAESGWKAECMPWLHERSVGMIGADTAQDVFPNPYAAIKAPVHIVGLVAMGLWLIDNCDLEELASTCEHLDRWAFLCSVAPLRIRGGTGSPVNPIALF
jgi:kynurenine formamidase